MSRGSGYASSNELYVSELLKLCVTNPPGGFYDQLKNDHNKTNDLHNASLEEYKPIQSAFNSLCGILNEIEDVRAQAASQGERDCRPDMPAIHGTPGLGKSMFLDKFAEAVRKWKDSKSNKPELLADAGDWLRDCSIISVTYNNTSKFNEEIEQNYQPEETVSLRVLWSYFYEDSETHKYADFCTSFEPEIRRLLGLGQLPSLSQAIRVIRKHQSIVRKVEEDSIPILLLLDEPIMHRGIQPIRTPADREKHLRDAEEFVMNISDEMCSDSKLTVVFTTIDQLLTRNACFGSSRKVRWIGLHTLDFEDSYQLLAPLQKKAARHNVEPSRSRIQKLIKRCAVETSGHPRAIEAVYFKIESIIDTKIDGQNIEDIAHHKFLNSIVTNLPKLALPDVNAAALAFGLLGQIVRPTDSVTAESASMNDPTIADLVAAGVYLHSAAESAALIPQLSGLLVRHAVFSVNSMTFGDEEQRPIDKLLVDSPADAPAYNSIKVLKYLLRKLFELEPDVGNVNSEAKIDFGDPFERFHCLVELIKQHVRLICWLGMDFLKSNSRIIRGTYVCASLQEHYHLSSTTPKSGPKWNVLESYAPLTSKSKITGCLLTPLWWPLLSVEDSDEVNNARSFDDLLAAVRNAKRMAMDPNAVYTRADLFPFLIRRSPTGCAGFDASMLVRVDPSAGAEATAGRVWCILVECKHSDPKESKQQLDIETLRHKLQTIKEYVPKLLDAGADRVVYVVAAWRDLDADLCAGDEATANAAAAPQSKSARKNAKRREKRRAKAAAEATANAGAAPESNMESAKPKAKEASPEASADAPMLRQLELSKYFGTNAKQVTVLLLSRSQLREFYSPTFNPFADYFYDPCK